MPSNTPKDAIIIVFDVGKSVSTLHQYEEKSFFKQARGCISWIIQRKIISQSIDVLSLVLIGSLESYDTDTCENISQKFDFQVASWDMLKFVVKEVKSTNIKSDWFKGLIFSIQLLKAYEEYDVVQNKKIVIFSDFANPASDDLNIIVRKIEKLGIEITIIGPDHIYSSIDCDEEDEPKNKKKRSEKSQGRQDGEKIVYDLWKRVPERIVICTFESALKQLCSYTPKAKRVNYWNCLMDIGEVCINISMLKKTDPKPPKKFNTKCIKIGDGESSQSTSDVLNLKSENLAPTIRDTVMHYKHESGEERDTIEVEVKPEDTIEGYRYGATVIPFSEEDKTAMEYKPGPKAFSVLGFTRITNVPYYLLSGECSYLVLPRIKDKNAEVALSALIQGMKKLECLAIVKRVYSNDRGLSLGILYPVTEEIFSDESDDVTFREYLLYVELAFQDDVKSINFPSLKHFVKDINKKQYDAVDDLIDGMNLMKADKGLRGEPCEAFDLPYLHDFKEQFFHYCVIQKGLYPEKPLPTVIPPYIKNYTEVPKSVAEKRKSVVNVLKKQFKIKKLESENDGSDQTKSGESSSSKSWDKSKNIEHFSNSAIEAEKDSMTRTWMRLFQNGFPPIIELENVFIKLNAEPDPSKAAKSFGIVLSLIRRKYLDEKTNPETYNNWLISFKKYIKGQSGIFNNFWNTITNEYVCLVTNNENKNSKVTEKEAEMFFRGGEENPSTSEEEKPNFDLLDELQAEQMNLDSIF